jgi:hypothetical protein
MRSGPIVARLTASRALDEGRFDFDPSNLLEGQGLEVQWSEHGPATGGRDWILKNQSIYSMQSAH